MVSFAAARAGYAVRWSVADAMALPFDNSRFDLAVCQFGVMFFPDRLRAFREARRVLAPGGTYLFNVWYGLEDNDVARIVTEAVAAAFPDDPPMFLEVAPRIWTRNRGPISGTPRVILLERGALGRSIPHRA